MLISMTGFGEARKQTGQMSIAIEVRTINSRHFKLNYRASDGYAALESEVEAATREVIRKETAKPKAGRPKSYIFSYRAPTKAFKLQLKFNKSRVDKDEVISALENIIAELRSQ